MRSSDKAEIASKSLDELNKESVLSQELGSIILKTTPRGRFIPDMLGFAFQKVNRRAGSRHPATPPIESTAGSSNNYPENYCRQIRGLRYLVFHN